jgi:hypothetical protein
MLEVHLPKRRGTQCRKIARGYFRKKITPYKR